MPCTNIELRKDKITSVYDLNKLEKGIDKYEKESTHY